MEGEQPFNEAAACKPRPTVHWNPVELTLLISDRRNTAPAVCYCHQVLIDSVLDGATERPAAALHAALQRPQSAAIAVD